MQTSLNSLRTNLNKKLNKLELLEESLQQKQEALKEVREDVQNSEEVQIIMQTAAKMSQEHLASHLSTIVTQAVQPVASKPYEFVCEFVERRGATEADLYLVHNGNAFDILDSTGGGLGDVCSFALKVAYIILSNKDKVLIIDEVSRHINAPWQRENFAKILQKLSYEFGIQVIINTCIPELLAIADNVITLKEVNSESVVQQREIR